MLKAKDVMSTEVTTISMEASLTDAIELLIARKISGMPVVNAQGAMVGIITEKDIINFAFSGNLNNTTVKEAMTTNVTTFNPEADINIIAIAICHHKFRRVPIVENGKVVGIVSRRDVIRVALKLGKKENT